VLRAINTDEELVANVDTEGVFAYWKSPTQGGGSYRKGATWNLTKDNYDDQTEETKKFIGSLLGI
jgi:hypothetical protein